MIEQFAPYELALELKQLGFDEPCFGWYDCYSKIVNYEKAHNSCGWLNGNHCSAPTYSQAFRWFRDEHKLYAGIEGSKKDRFKWVINTDSFLYMKPSNNFEIYEEAELACLKNLIEIVVKSK